jgi:HSP20 family protein
MYYNNPYGCGYGDWRERHFGQNAPVNISETESEYTIHLHAPGLVKEHFNLTTQNDILHIRYKGDDKPKKDFIRREYRSEDIGRSFDLTGKVNTDAITATYAEGILTVALPKR